MRRLLILLLVIILNSVLLYSQTSQGVSPVRKLNLRKAPKLPPKLIADITFIDPSGNNALDAEETIVFLLKIENIGLGNASNVQLNLLPKSIPDFSFEPEIAIGDLKPGEIVEKRISFSANWLVKSQTIDLLFNFTEANNFQPDPHALNFEVSEFIPPNLVLVDGLDIDDWSKDGMVEAGELVTITAAIQNIGYGQAKDIKAHIEFGMNVFSGGESLEDFFVRSLKPGEIFEFTFQVFTNTKAVDIPILVSISESYGSFGKKNVRLPIAFKERVKNITEMKIVGIENKRGTINISDGYEIDVDNNIPETKINNKYAVAVIIGNRNYSNPDVPTVDFAIRDAAVMKEYLISAFGYQEGNIIYLEDATQGAFYSTFGTVSRNGRLHNYIKENQSDVFVYYSGHGAPDPETKDGYFVPVDCDPSMVALNGYSLDLFYSQIRKLKARSVTVVIDACFSGSSDKGMLLKNISPVFIEVDQKALTGNNSVIFTSAGGDQVSSWYPEKKHSLFTYYYLKGIQGEANINGDKSLTVGELHDYLEENVSYMARRLNNREQTTQITGDQKTVLYRY